MTEEKGKQPDYTNRQEGAAAWFNTDKNGNPYLSVKLPLNLGVVNLFQNTKEE